MAPAVGAAAACVILEFCMKRSRSRVEMLRRILGPNRRVAEAAHLLALFSR
jgi:hypothetical protein